MNVRLTEKLVRQIRAHYRRTGNYAATGRAFGLPRQRAREVITLNWQHIGAETRSSSDRLHQVLDPSPSTWTADAIQAVRGVALRLAEFTADDVTDVDRSRLGPVMLLAQGEGICSITDEFAISKRPASHHRPVRVWRSEIFESKPTRTRTKEKRS